LPALGRLQDTGQGKPHAEQAGGAQAQKIAAEEAVAESIEIVHFIPPFDIVRCQLSVVRCNGQLTTDNGQSPLDHKRLAQATQ
jgi:hypothetical protein